MPTILRVCRVLIFLNICSCWGQVQFPTYSYILPAIADKGGPAYVIPGTVTEESTISLTNVTGSVCLRTGYCTNAAGIVTAAAGNTTAPGSDSFFIALQPDGSEQEFEYGAVLISIEGVGYRQVFPANKANGLNSISPPTRLNVRSRHSNPLPSRNSQSRTRGSGSLWPTPITRTIQVTSC